MPNILRLVGNHLVWDSPVEDHEWEVLTNGQRRTLAIDCVLSEDQTAPPFRLFVSIHGNQFGSTKERLIRENSTHLKNPKQWKISSRNLHPERVGITRFIGAPVLTIAKYWRQAFIPHHNRDFILQRVVPGSMVSADGPNKVSVGLHCDSPVNMLIEWPGIFREELGIGEDLGTFTVIIKPEFNAWLRKNTKGAIYPFSDFKSTFEREDDEWAYMTDFHPALDSNPPSR